MKQRGRPTRPSPTTTHSLTTKRISNPARPADNVVVGRSALGRLCVALALVLGACGTTVDSGAPADDSGDLPDGFDVQGHRGARGLRPENTLPAFEAALDLGVTTLELDLHFSADDQVVVWHDPVVDETKCGAGAQGTVAVRSLTAQELAGFVCDQNPDPERFPDQVAEPGALAGADYGIITLGQLFEFVERYAASPDKTDAQRAAASDVMFNIETKRVRAEPANIDDGFDGTNPGEFELAVLAAIADAGFGDRVVIQSFDHRSLRAIATVNADIRLAPLTGDRVANPGLYAEWGADIWSPRASTLDAAGIEAAHAAGLLVVPWTVNDMEDVRALIELGVDGVITDRPDLVLAGS